MTAWDRKTPIYEISSLESIADAIETCIDAFDHEAPFFRGHGDADWPLVPRVYREGAFLDGTAGYYDEQSILSFFVHRGSMRTPSPPHRDDRIAWLHLAQHYGLPTRLLDWSRNILVAVFFAVVDRESTNCDGCVWSLSPSSLNAVTWETDAIPSAFHTVVEKSALSAFTGRAFPDTPSTFAIDALQGDLRMMVQQSGFTIHQTADDLRTLATPKPLLLRFVVPQSAKAALYRTLYTVGISYSALFPDLEGLAKELRETRFAKR